MNDNAGLRPFRSRLWQLKGSSRWLVFLEENDLRGSNLGSFIMDLPSRAWIDPPGNWHGGQLGGCNLAFADGHVRFHRFADRRTARIQLIDGTYPSQPQPDNVDLIEFASIYAPAD